jgi:transcriptional regulator with XRE-family HTH domain
LTEGSIGVKPMTLDDEEFFREIGHRLRQRREALGWTQAELARRCRLNKAYVGFLERGERNASLVNLRRIAKVLRVRLSDLLKGLD